jgi:hypothetical protein
MNIKSLNSASRRAALAAVTLGVIGFGVSATAMADTTAGTPAGTTTQLISPAHPATPATTGCERITFDVLHNDRTGGIKLPQGPYVVWSSGMSCKAASQEFTNFLDHHQGAIPGWTGHQEAPGYGSYTNSANGQSFSIGHMADQ